MHRRSFLALSLLAPWAARNALAESAPGATRGATRRSLTPDGTPHTFALGAREFLLDGAPFQIRAGEMHPIRIPADYWRHRIRMARSMGLNTISLYVMWNALESEPGTFDLAGGSRDVARFLRTCQAEGMWAYLRPGPYICGEWDFGGLPPYLLRTPDIRVRDRTDAHYMAAVRRYIATMASVVAPLMAANGGPVLMVQVENEYASFGRDLAYLEELRSLWTAHGVEGPFSVSDGLGQIRQAGTYLPGAALGLDGDTEFAAAQDIAGEMPVWMGEGYPGWLTHWGDASFAASDFVPTLRQLLRDGRSFNLYVVHGGTNFGFGAGANAHGDYSHFQPVITSYDYGAPIDERGAATPAYHVFRTMLAAGAPPLPDIPGPPPTASFAAVTPVPYASLWDNLPASRRVITPQANELLFAQDHGLVLYRRSVAAGGTLALDAVRDYATVFLDGRYVDYVSRVEHPALRRGMSVALPAAGAAGARLEILVDSFGHVGYGPAMADRKGIVDAIRLDGTPLEEWDAVALPLDDAWLTHLVPLRGAPLRPGIFFRATVALERPGDCYIDVADWSKGYLWVNRQLLGRYWNIGPQQRLYCPAPWLRAGENEILLLDLHRVTAAPVRCAASLAG